MFGIYSINGTKLTNWKRGLQFLKLNVLKVYRLTVFNIPIMTWVNEFIFKECQDSKSYRKATEYFFWILPKDDSETVAITAKKCRKTLPIYFPDKANQLGFTFSKLTIEALEQGVKYVQRRQSNAIGVRKNISGILTTNWLRYFTR